MDTVGFYDFWLIGFEFDYFIFIVFATFGSVSGLQITVFNL